MKISVGVNIGEEIAESIREEASSKRQRIAKGRERGDDVFQSVRRDEMIELLVKRAQAGEVEAFGKLYDSFVDQIYRYIYFRVPKDDAEDLTEMVFLKAWEKIHQYKPSKKSFAAWIFRIAHNLVVDTYRFGKDKEFSELTPDIAEHRRENDPIVMTEDKLHSDFLKEALSKIKPKYRQVIVLKFINELSNTEISAILKKSEGGIRILQFRALKALRIELENKGMKFL